MKIQLNKLTRVTARETNLSSSARDFQRRQFKKSPIRVEREGYAKETAGVLAWE